MKSRAHRTTRLHKPTAAHKVRIIGGQFRRTLLPVVEAPELRPTPDRVRETLFNWLAHLFHHDFRDLRALDLFAGTGALGMEAVSRGFGHVTLVEREPRIVAALEALRRRLNADNVLIVKHDAYRYIRATAERYDVIFLDPPFDHTELESLMVTAAQALRPSGLLYVETGKPVQLPPGFHLVRQDRAGAVHFYLLQPDTVLDDSQTTQQPAALNPSGE